MHGQKNIKLSTCVWKMPMKNSVRTITIVFRGFPWITSAFFHIPNKLFTDYLTSQCCTELNKNKQTECWATFTRKFILTVLELYNASCNCS